MHVRKAIFAIPTVAVQRPDLEPTRLFMAFNPTDSACNRRQAMRAMTVTGGILLAEGLAPDLLSAAAGPNSSSNGWIDAHVHLWTPDVAQFPLMPGAGVSGMQPPSFTPAEFMAHAAPCGVTRAVLIQMSFYGYDNSYMLHVIAEQPDVYRGVAVIDPGVNLRETMARLRPLGVRGFRIGGADAWQSSEDMLAMWHHGAELDLAMCLLINPPELPAIAAMCRRFPRTPVVIDHCARIGTDGSVRADDLDRLCRLAQFESVRVKVSAFYALGEKHPPYADLGPMIKRLLDAFGRERLMWGTDCPYQVRDHHTVRDSVDLIERQLDFLTDEDRVWLLRKSAERQFFAS